MTKAKWSYHSELVSESMDNENLTGDNCPVCGYPIVIEMGLEVCYNCGWSNEEKE